MYIYKHKIQEQNERISNNIPQDGLLGIPHHQLSLLTFFLKGLDLKYIALQNMLFEFMVRHIQNITILTFMTRANTCSLFFRGLKAAACHVSISRAHF